MSPNNYLKHIEDLESHYRICACRSSTPFFKKRLYDDEFGHTRDLKGKYYRTHYQHDRDKILYSPSFRRLKFKTQIFPEHTADHLRTRLDHTLEVAQISRHLARQLKLNEDLVDAIGLAHDIGHTPFAHSGERAFNNFLLEHDGDGFKHNWQGLRIVDKLEKTYEKIPGLDLTRAVRIGILNHTKLRYKEMKDHQTCYCEMEKELEKDFDPRAKYVDLLEVQLVRMADEFAQEVHDFEDAIISDSISLAEVVRNKSQYGIIEECLKNIEEKSETKINNIDLTNGENRDFLLSRIRSELIFQLTIDCLQTSSDKIDNWEASNFGGPPKDGIRKFNRFVKDRNDFPPFISLGKMKIPFEKFKDQIYEKVVKTERISRMDGRADYIIRRILKVHLNKPLQVHDLVFERYKHEKGLDKTLDFRQCREEDNQIIKLKGDPVFRRSVIDYIAGMTDRFAIREYDQLYSAYPRVDL